ncbi:MAG: hypothetical protein HYU37_00605 [Acidobacteria bacterium]|nr:hypothetical protein [Acidobacteriota bacterium]
MLIPSSAEQFLRLQDDAKVERRRLKALERVAEDRILDPWERYRALTDHAEHLLDLTELYDRKTRFALLILGGLNALNLLIVARSDLLPSIDGSPLLAAYAGCYTLLSLGLLLYAIAALKPRAAADASARREEVSLLDGATAQTVEEYCARWRDAQVGEITRELAAVAFTRARTNALKLRALNRVYFGLYVLVGVTAALCVGVAWLG